MSEAIRCSECGAGLPIGTPKGLCPKCALLGALELSNGGSQILQTQDIASVSPPRSPTPVGQLPASRIFGDYELLEEIARGGMGVVYKARQKSLDRLVAVKMLLFGGNAGADFIQRFRIEASAAASLQHPNIVAIHEVGVHGGEHFLVMDFVEGSNLARLARDQILSPKRTAQYLKTIAEAIHYAHEHGILHRDLKPSNVLIDACDQPRVTDFGLAKVLTTDSQLSTDHAQLTHTGHVLGSPGYMPPEQAGGARNKVSRRSDVYSLGAMLYHLLTGRPPFVGGSISETLQQVETQEPVTPRLLNPGVPLDLETICLKCLEKDPDRRYQTSRELSEELGRFLNDETIHARPVGRVEKIWRWGRRNPLAAAFLGTVCAALVTSLSLLYLVNQAKNKQVELTSEVQDANRELSASAKVILSMTEESLDSIWANKNKRSMVLKSEIIAALADPSGSIVADTATPVRWTNGLIVDAIPGMAIRNSAPLLSALEKATSQTLGRPVRVDVKLYKFQEDFDADLSAGLIDFGRMGALRFLRIKRRTPEIIPLVMPTTSYKTGMLFTSTRTDIRTVEDIRGRSFAFGDTNSTVSFWAQIKLAEYGITATNLSRYDQLDSTLEFAEDVAELGESNAVSRIGYLHSHAQVIKGVLNGLYDVGVAMEKAFRRTVSKLAEDFASL